MEITVKKDELIAEIKKGLTEYEGEFKKGVTIFAKKHGEYQKYLEKYIQNIASVQPTSLKHPPYPPNWRRDEFIDILQSLEAHQQATIIMKDREYNNAKKGIQDLAAGQTVANIAMMDEVY